MHSSTAHGNDCGPLTVQTSSWIVLCLELSVLTLNSLKTGKTNFWSVFFPTMFGFQLFSLLTCFPEINRQSRISKREKSEFVTIFLNTTLGFWGWDLLFFCVWFWGFYLAKDHWSFRGKKVWAIVVIFQRIKKIHNLQGTQLSFLWKYVDDTILFY